MQDAGQQSSQLRPKLDRLKSNIFPLRARLRSRIIAIAGILLLAGIASLIFGLRPVAYHAVAAVNAPLSPDDGLGRKGWIAQQQHELEERELLLQALQDTGLDSDPEVAAEPKGRAAPHISLRRSGQSDMVRIVATASDPVSAAKLANKAAQLLVDRERLQWNRLLPKLLQIGQITPQQAVQGPNVAILHAAPVPRRSNTLLRSALRIGGIAALLACLLLGVLLLADNASVEIVSSDRSEQARLSVSVVAALGRTSQDVMTGRGDPQSTLLVSEAFWTWIASTSAERRALKSDLPVAILVAPCTSAPAVISSVAVCADSALKMARLASKRGIKTLLVDVIVATSATKSVGLQLPKLPGLAEVLSGQTAADNWFLEDDEAPNLTALCAGNIRIKDNSLYSLQPMSHFFESLQSKFQLVIMNCPPVLGERAIADFWQDAGSWSDVGLIMNDSTDIDSTSVERAAVELLSKGIAVIGQIICAGETSVAIGE